MTDEDKQIAKQMGEVLTSDKSILDKARALKRLDMVSHPGATLLAIRNHPEEYEEVVSYISDAIKDFSHPDHDEAMKIAMEDES